MTESIAQSQAQTDASPADRLPDSAPTRPEPRAPAAPFESARVDVAPLLGRALTRRTLLGAAGGGAVSAAIGGTAYGLEKRREEQDKIASTSSDAHTAANGQLLKRNLQLRIDRAAEDFEAALPAHPTNGDERLYVDKIGSDTRGLPHDRRGEVDLGDPTKLIPYVGPPLTVGGELNKLATNIGQGRNWAGIHFRSDAA